MKASMFGGALLSLMLVTGGASAAMESDALKASREALDRGYEESIKAMEAMEAMEEATEDRIEKLEAEVKALKQELDTQANQ